MMPFVYRWLVAVIVVVSVTTSCTTDAAIHFGKSSKRPAQTPAVPASAADPAWLIGVKNSMASAMAAACSKLLLAPLDTIKTLQQQTSGVQSITMLEAGRILISRPNGIRELYAGIGVAVVGSMPSVGLYFGVYGYCKKVLARFERDAIHQRRVEQWAKEVNNGKSSMVPPPQPPSFYLSRTMSIALSAAIGNTIASASRVPYEVIKQKLQTRAYANLGEALADMSLKTLFPTGGIASQMLRDIPYAVVTLLTYEHLRQVWKPRAIDRFGTDVVPARAWDLMVGGTSGGIGSYVTNPMDVIKTRLQTTASGCGGSIRECAKLTWQEGGPQAFLRGSVPRLLHKVPANALFFLFYEFFRSVLRVKEEGGIESATK